MDNFLTQFNAISPIDWFAMIAGIVGVYLSIKERILAWPLFISMLCRLRLYKLTRQLLRLWGHECYFRVCGCLWLA